VAFLFARIFWNIYDILDVRGGIMVYTKYPNSIDSSTELPVSTDLVTPVKSEVVNRHRDSIIAVESELGTKPSGTYTTVRARLDAIESGGGGGGGSADGYAPTQRNLPVTVNGQTIFSLGINPSLPSATELFVNGIKYAYGTDFSVTGATVTWAGPISLLTTDVVDVIFFRAGTGAPVQVTIPVTVNGQTIFHLGTVPVLPYATEFFVNGVKNRFGTDFTLSGSTITYTGAPALVTTDVIDVTYIIASGSSSGGGGGGGNQTWGQTLALGNISSGTDAILSTGDSLRGETNVEIAAAPGATGSDVDVSGGLGTAGTGGNIQLASGDGSAGGGNFSAYGGSSTNDGGWAAIFGGNSSGAEGGPCGILGGFGSTDGGFVDIWAGIGNVDGGEITVLAGYGAGGDGGSVDIEAGDGSVNGGWTDLYAGNGGTAGGGIDIEAGFGNIGGGNVYVYAGGADTGVGGSIDIGAGDVSTSGIGGDVLIRAGAGVEANAGNVSVIGGSVNSVALPVSGGTVNITGGIATGAAHGGDVEIYGGQGVNNGGGSVTVSGGGASGGTGAGSVSILTQSAGSGTGSIYLTTAAITGAPGGHIELQTGDSSAAGPGHIKLTTGDATGGGVTGANITIQSSNITHPASGAQAGSIFALAGYTAGAGAGGGAYIEGGDSSAGIGGTIELRSGDGYTGGGLAHLWGGNDTNPSPGISSGGAVQVQGGDSINGIGGNVNIIPGTGGGGDGHVIIDGYTEINDDLAVTGKLYLDGLIDPPGMVFTEQPSVPGGLPNMGKVTLWARDSDGYLVCTDPTGREVVVNGGQTLAQTLAIGNNTGGSDIVLGVGDQINGDGDIVLDSDSDGYIIIKSGTTEIARFENNSGDPRLLFAESGNPVIAQSDRIGESNASDFTIQAQNADAGAFGGYNGGRVEIYGGDSVNSGLGGGIKLHTGHSANGAGGDIDLLAYSDSGSCDGKGGSVNLWGGLSINDDGGDIFLGAGDSPLGLGGNVTLQSGNSDDGIGGYVSIKAGSSSGFGDGGELRLEAGNGLVGPGGHAYIYGGSSSGGPAGHAYICGGSSSVGMGGQVNINGGIGSIDSYGGTASLSGGDGNYSNGNGGDAFVNGGVAGEGHGLGNGGNAWLKGGSGVGDGYQGGNAWMIGGQAIGTGDGYCGSSVVVGGSNNLGDHPGDACIVAGDFNATGINVGDIKFQRGDEHNRVDLFSIIGSTGNADLNSHKIINSLDPNDPQDVATKNYIDNPTVISPTTISSSPQNNYSPTDWDTAAIVRISTADDGYHITGFAADTAKVYRKIINVGAKNITLDNLSGSSTASNQLIVPGGSDLVLLSNYVVDIFYDVVSAKWRCV
jgi:hypothetical protein